MITNKQQKRYWIISSAPTLRNDLTATNKVEVKLPVFFTNSMNNRFIEVRNCKVIYRNALVNDVKFHSDLVKEDPFDDHFVCFTNEVLVKPKKYRWNSSDKTITFWFTNMNNQEVEIDQYHIDILLMY
jgi:hypothetical protein